jgi:hypothetical protein
MRRKRSRMEKALKQLIPINSILFLLSVSVACFALDDRTESLSISTYYPAPYGVYRNPRLVPLDQEPDCSSDQENCRGTMYFNNSDKQLYIFNGSAWSPLGFGGSAGPSGLKIESDHLVSPDWCDDTMYSFWGKDQVCEWDGWYKNITFTTNFNSIPQVIVVQERNPDPNNITCADNMTSGFHIWAENIKKTGFRINAASGIDYWSRCDEGGGGPPLCSGNWCSSKQGRIEVDGSPSVIDGNRMIS